MDASRDVSRASSPVASVSGSHGSGANAPQAAASTAPAPFRFTAKQGKIDFRSLGRLDLARIRREVDVDALQSMLSNVTFATVDTGDIAAQTDESLAHIIRYMQSCLEYMMYVQVAQAQTVENLQQEHRRLSGLLTTRDTENSTLKLRLKSEKKTAHALQGALTQRSGSAFATVASGTALVAVAGEVGSCGTQSLVFKCDLCPKVFRTRDFLESHIGRRHPGTAIERNVAALADRTNVPAEDVTVSELRAQRELFARELAARNTQLAEALATTKSLSAAALERLKKEPDESFARAAAEDGSQTHLITTLTATISNLARASENERYSELRAEMANLKHMMQATPPKPPAPWEESEYARMVVSLRDQMVDLERTVATELANNRAALTAHVGPLLDDTPAPAPAPAISPEEIANIAATASAQQLAAVEQRLTELQTAIKASEEARIAAESLAKAAVSRLPTPKATPESAPTAPPPGPATPQAAASLLPSPKLTPAPAPAPALSKVIEPFTLTHQWQRLPESTEGWTAGRARRALADASGAEARLPASFHTWLPLLPAATAISTTKPPRVRIPDAWDLVLDAVAPNEFKEGAAAPRTVTINVTRTTTVRQIREKASALLGAPLASLHLRVAGLSDESHVVDLMTCEELDLFIKPAQVQVVSPLSDDGVKHVVQEFTDQHMPMSAAAEAVETQLLQDAELLAAAKSSLRAERPSLAVPRSQVVARRETVEANAQLRAESGQPPSPDATHLSILAAAEAAAQSMLPPKPHPVIQRLRESGQELQRSLAAVRSSLEAIETGETAPPRPEKVAALKKGVLYATKYLLEQSFRGTPSAEGSGRAPSPGLVQEASGAHLQQSPVLPPILAAASSTTQQTADKPGPVVTIKRTASPSAAERPVMSQFGPESPVAGELESGDDASPDGVLDESVQDRADRYEAEAEHVDPLGRSGQSAGHESPETRLSSTFGQTQISDLTASQFLSPVSKGDRETSMEADDSFEDAFPSQVVRHPDNSLTLSQSLGEDLAGRMLLQEHSLHAQSTDSLSLSPTAENHRSSQARLSNVASQELIPELVSPQDEDDELVEEDLQDSGSGEDAHVHVAESFASRAPAEPKAAPAAAPSMASRPSSARHSPAPEHFDDIEEETLPS